MSRRREELLARFRGIAAARFERVRAPLEAVRGGRATPEQIEELAREFHTTKGEARMLGLAPVSTAAHYAEQLLGAITAPGAAREPGGAQIAELLDAMSRLVRADAASEVEAREALARLLPDAPGAPAAPDAPTAPAGATAAPAEPAARRWVQVDAAHVDDLCERLAQLAADVRGLQALVAAAPGRRHESPAARARADAVEQCLRQLAQVDESAWALRVSPAGPLLDALAQHARDLAAGQGKSVRVEVRGGGVAIEREVLDAAWDPMVHVVTNAIDHGIEAPAARGAKPAEARVEIVAEPSGAHVSIVVRDDGRGIDLDEVHRAAVARGLAADEAANRPAPAALYDLLFRHGFSTRGHASELSGRGVGLGAVRAALDRVGGTVEVESELGRGTAFTLRLPARMSKEHTLVVDAGGALFGIAAREIVRVVRQTPGEVPVVEHRGALVRVDDRVPSRSLASLAPAAPTGEPWTLVVETGGGLAALHVASIVGEHDVVMRPLDRVLGALGYVRASATLDDGRLVLILSPGGVLSRVVAPRRAADAPGPPAGAVRPASVLVADDSAIVRSLVSEILSDAGLEVRLARDGAEALASIESVPPDAVLSDVEMPNMDGFELLRRIRARRPALPVVLLTTRATPEDRARAAALGVTAYLTKNEFGRATLVEVLRSSMQGVA